MKISTFLIFLTAIQVSAKMSYGQDAKVSLNVKSTKVFDLLNEIEKQTQYLFFYSPREINVERSVSLEAKNQKVSDVLSSIFEGTEISYMMVNDHIVLTKRKDLDRISTSMVNSEKQATKVTGVVTDATTGEPLPGVNIVINGTSNGVVTDLDGKYSIEVNSGKDILIFSYVGYNSERVEISNRSSIDVAMVPDIKKLEEVVVIGYGTQKKADVTSSVATVKADNFIKGSVTDAGQLISGKVAGLSIISPSGDPTSSTQILLRGQTTLMGANQNPLILIDGIPGDMKTVAPQEIETIDVLKDGSAAAIYGTRGNNGVILITTKKAGVNAKNTVEYSTYFSTQAIARKLNLSTAADFRAQLADGLRKTEMADNGASTDWLKEVTRTPLTQSHNLTFRGGNEKTNYLANLNYENTEGIFRKSYNQAFSGHVDFNHSMFDNKLKFNINLFNSSGKWNGFNTNIYTEVLRQNPTSPVKSADGTWFQELTKFDYENPVSDLYESDGQANNQIGRYKGAITFTPIAGLKFSSVFSYGKYTQENGYAETKQHVSTLRNSKNGYANLGGNESIDRLAELTAEYSKSIAKHNFMVLGGYSYQEND